MSAAARDREAGLAAMRPLFAFLLAFYVLTGSGHLYLGDAWSVVRTAEALVTRGELAIPFDPMQGGKFGPGGKYYAKYGAGSVAHHALPAAVGHALVKVAERRASPPGALPAGAELVLLGLPASLVNAPFAALAGALFFGIAVRLGYAPRAALWTTLALAGGTMLWPYAKHDAFEAPLAAMLLLSLWMLSGAAPRPGAAGLALGWAMLVKPVAVLAAPGLAWLAWRRPDRGAASVAKLAAGPAVAVVAILAYNALRFGNALETGYSAAVQGYTIPAWMGVYGLLLSAGKGLLWYSPALAFALWGARTFAARHPDEHAAIGLTFGLHVLFYGFQQNWDGDWCWGPRYLLPVVPFAMLYALPVFERAGREDGGWRRAARALVWAAAIGVQVVGVLVDPSDYVRWMSDRKATFGDFLKNPAKVYIPMHPHHFNPDFSPIRGHAHMLGALLANARGAEPAPLVIYSSVEERMDPSGHHLEEVLAIPLEAERLKLDLWLPLMAQLARPWLPLYLAVWAAFGAVAMVLLRARRWMWRAVRLAEAADAAPRADVDVRKTEPGAP